MSTTAIPCARAISVTIALTRRMAARGSSGRRSPRRPASRCSPASSRGGSAAAGRRARSAARISPIRSRYVASGTPCTTSFTPMRSVTKSGLSAASAGQLDRDHVGRSEAVHAQVGDELEADRVAVERADELVGQRSGSFTDVPIVYESPRAT